jgi:hypothetical protein
MVWTVTYSRSELGPVHKNSQLSAFAGALLASVIALAGCDGAGNPDGEGYAVDPSIPVERSSHAGDVAFRIDETVRARGRDIPLTLYLGLQPETETATRLSARALLDLRELQQALPELLSGPIEPSCDLGVDLRFLSAEVVTNEIRATARAAARLYRCRDRGTANERRGAQFFTQTIDLEAAVGMSKIGDCIAFRLADLDLDPRGLLGRLATLFGVTDRARSAIVEKARVTLVENPVCPDIPEELSLLDLDFATAELSEIEPGGVGAALAGSVDIAAGNLVALLSLVGAEARNAAGATDHTGRPVFRLNGTLDADGADIPYAADVRLSAVTPTRIAVDSTLDLRELQRRLPRIAEGKVPLDTCGGRVTLRSLETEAAGSTIVATGRLTVETFDCERTGPGSWERGGLLKTEEVGVRADLSAELVEGCVVFRLLDLRRDPPGAFSQLETGSGRIEAARTLLLDAVRLYLEEAAVCPALPPEVAVLDPDIGAGGPTEIGEGGVGVALAGSLDVSPRAIIDLLRLLQERGTLPPSP